jgi:hypothetical protein
MNLIGKVTYEIYCPKKASGSLITSDYELTYVDIIGENKELIRIESQDNVHSFGAIILPKDIAIEIAKIILGTDEYGENSV